MNANDEADERDDAPESRESRGPETDEPTQDPKAQSQEPPADPGRRALLSGLLAAGAVVPVMLGASGMNSLLASVTAPAEGGVAPAPKHPTCPATAVYTDGENCPGAYGCASFICEGGILDDFECYSVFKCVFHYDCNYSFDNEDCDPATSFVCLSVYHDEDGPG